MYENYDGCRVIVSLINVSSAIDEKETYTRLLLSYSFNCEARGVVGSKPMIGFTNPKISSALFTLKILVYQIYLLHNFGSRYVSYAVICTICMRCSHI